MSRWNDFVQQHKGKGMSMSELAKKYRQQGGGGGSYSPRRSQRGGCGMIGGGSYSPRRSQRGGCGMIGGARSPKRSRSRSPQRSQRSISLMLGGTHHPYHHTYSPSSSRRRMSGGNMYGGQYASNSLNF